MGLVVPRRLVLFCHICIMYTFLPVAKRKKGGTLDIKDLPENIRDRAEACKTREELLALAQEVGHELTDEELESVSGGKWDFCVSYSAPRWIATCPRCGKTTDWPKTEPKPAACSHCGYPLVNRNFPPA